MKYMFIFAAKMLRVQIFVGCFHQESRTRKPHLFFWGGASKCLLPSLHPRVAMHAMVPVRRPLLLEVPELKGPWNIIFPWNGAALRQWTWIHILSVDSWAVSLIGLGDDIQTCGHRNTSAYCFCLNRYIIVNGIIQVMSMLIWYYPDCVFIKCMYFTL